jgi:hypothetical protein
MSREELELLESLLKNFLTYEVTYDVMLIEDVTRALAAVQREMEPVQLSFDFEKDINA